MGTKVFKGLSNVEFLLSIYSYYYVINFSFYKEQVQDYSQKLNLSAEQIREIEKHYKFCYK